VSVELEGASRGELQDLAEDQANRIDELESEMQELQGLMQAYSRQLDLLKTVIIGDADGLAAIDGYGEGYNVLDRMEQYEAQLDGFAERLHEIPTQPSEQQDTEGRLHAIRKYLVRQAHEDNKNIYGADYKEIVALFDGGISDSWASQLMDKAVGTYPGDPEEPKEGFEVADTEPRQKIRVYVEKIEDRSLLRLKNSKPDT